MKTMLHNLLSILLLISLVSCGSDSYDQSQEDADQKLSEITAMRTELEGLGVRFSKDTEYRAYGSYNTKFTVQYNGANTEIEKDERVLQVLRVFVQSISNFLDNYSSEDWFISHRDELEKNMETASQLIPKIEQLIEKKQELQRKEDEYHSLQLKENSRIEGNIDNMLQIIKTTEKHLKSLDISLVFYKFVGELHIPIYEIKYGLESRIDAVTSIADFKNLITRIEQVESEVSEYFQKLDKEIELLNEKNIKTEFTKENLTKLKEIWGKHTSLKIFPEISSQTKEKILKEIEYIEKNTIEKNP
ncbi:MAG: hypothetical protein H6622_06140 [Halobacteriovoraceae bacterium]|nr:hypothetical protein [Halobacteriovoraceae bacterium]